MGQRQSTRDCWDKYWVKNNLLYVNKIIEVLAPYLSKDKRILEIGAGSGATALKLTEYSDWVTCLDYSRSSIELIKKNRDELQTRMSILQGDAFRLPIVDQSVDICYHQGLIEHFKNPEEMIKEQFRVLKKDGILLVQVPQRYCLMTIQKHILISLGKWFAGWETEYSERQLSCLLKRNGFTPLKSAGMYRFRNLDRIQIRYLKRRIVPAVIEKLYHAIMVRIEDSFIGPWTAYGLLIIARKNQV